jgi:hypothetical protein
MGILQIMPLKRLYFQDSYCIFIIYFINNPVLFINFADDEPARSYFKGSGLPIPSNGFFCIAAINNSIRF